MGENIPIIESEVKSVNVCKYKILKGYRKGQDCGIQIRDVNHKFCYQHRKTYEKRKLRIDKINELGIGI